MDHQQQQISKVCLNCPRCNSTNTKFCYYNNYSLSQPRHFCKACKRYWTKGGSLRNVPVGGGSRKNSKRVKNNIVLLPSSTSTLSSILVDPLLSSSNQVSRIPTSTIPTDIQGASNDVLTPSLFGTYKDVMIQHQLQLCNIHSEMNYAANTNNDPTDTLFFSGFNNTIVEYDALQNVAPPSSSIFQQANTNIQQLLERVFPFQTMQRQQQKQQPSNNTTTGHHNLGGQQQQEQTWNTNHDPHNSSMMHTWGSGYRRNVTLWPPNQPADMDG